MPLIQIDYRNNCLDDDLAEELRETLVTTATMLFPVHGRELTRDSFSVSFRPEGKWDRMTHDVIVRVFLHPDTERLEASERHATELHRQARYVMQEIGGSPRTVGVSITYATIEWADGSR